MKNVKRKKVLKPWARIILLAILVVFAFKSILDIYNGKHPNVNNTPDYNYNINKKIDYKVHLKPNDFYQEEFLGENLQYTSELIDFVSIDYTYLLNGSKKADFGYKYTIVATIIGEYENSTNGRSELWKKKYNLINTREKEKINTTGFEMTHNVKINYDDYNNIVNNFRSKFKLAIDAYLNVKLTIDYKSNILDNQTNIKDQDYMEINIPLNTSTIKIETNNIGEESKQVDKTKLVHEDTKKVKKGYYMLAMDVILLALLLPYIFVSNKSIYYIELKKIMKNYSEIIVEIESLPSFEGLELLELKEFDDIVDIEEETKSPILYYEKEQNMESWFLVIINKYAYRFVLKK